ncbi:MAG: UDP-N-acetylmuramoyl-L-alanyl-D-glutamate--2,6-diaminopimelate ligase [candidate division Zixibacteria bacterium]|nr:UDP-N-acetylmuramoyl-L-alanyl-D-glutamate--2,6-diaminopimelate ligase [candidate division Zixibacteria bacterium]
MVTFGELVERVEDIKITGDPTVTINKVEVDSRLITTDDLFVAIPGFADDGLKYVADAAHRGAVAVVAPVAVATPLRVVGIVGDIRRAVARIAARYYDYPSRKLKLVVVTGTNGKTTITWLLKSILEQRGKPVGVIGTLGYFTAEHVFDPVNTTPGPLDLERLLTIMHNEGVRYVAMEVSSHALSMNRVDELEFQVAAICNITQDHFDYHKTFENYRDAKARLLDLVEGAAKWAVLNRDDPSFEYLEKRVRSSSLSFSFENRRADVRLEDLIMSTSGSSFTLVTPLGKERVNLKLLGRFNVENALCASACALALGLDPLTIARGLEEREFVNGRAHKVDVGQPFTVLIDYAHTPDALAKILDTARQICKGRLLVLFGCGGDRDRTKRPLMAQAVSTRADVVIVTSDNPRTEDPLAIIAEIKPGLDRSKETVIQPDRRAAIAEALALCRPDDLLVIAGKGHENYQILGTHKIHFDDREIVEEILRGRTA